MQDGGGQLAMPKQDGSAQSIRPLPSSSMPLPQISILGPLNAEKRRLMNPACAALCALTMNTYRPAGRLTNPTAFAESSSNAQESWSASHASPGAGNWYSAKMLRADWACWYCTSSPAVSASVKAIAMSPPGIPAEQVDWKSSVAVRVFVWTFFTMPPTTSVPMSRSGAHSLPTQDLSFLQARSWQSMRPLPSSSLPLAQISGVTVPVDSVTDVGPGRPGYESTISQ